LTTSSFLLQQRGQTGCSFFSLFRAGFYLLSLLFLRQKYIYDEYVNRIWTGSFTSFKSLELSADVQNANETALLFWSLYLPNDSHFKIKFSLFS
jgi:hypothetical protein